MLEIYSNVVTLRIVKYIIFRTERVILKIRNNVIQTISLCTFSQKPDTAQSLWSFDWQNYLGKGNCFFFEDLEKEKSQADQIVSRMKE